VIPASHLLAGFVIGRFARATVPAAEGRPRPWRDPLVVGSMAASLFPDLDVLPGLALGYDGVEFHRGATHSPVGVLLDAALMAPVGVWLWTWLRRWAPELEPAPKARTLFWALLAGMALHALTDFLNPWGVSLWWPISRDGGRLNLVHEGDPVFLALMALCAAAALVGSARVIALTTTVALAGFLAWKLKSRADAHAVAVLELGAEAKIYPAPAPDCPWSALSNRHGLLEAACVEPGAAQPFRLVRSARSDASPLVEASKAHPAVIDFQEDRPFAFAQLERASTGQTVVLWRDLRESLLESPQDRPSGLAVVFDEDGQVTAIDHRWLLKVSF
jgi:membrane-bound metal-dependent hydrolase YbcI (DUF457 family)